MDCRRHFTPFGSTKQLVCLLYPAERLVSGLLQTSILLSKRAWEQGRFSTRLAARWPKHPCTDSSLKSESSLEFNAPVIRSSNEMLEVYHAVQKFGLDPAAKYIADFGEPAWDILSVIRVVRVGFDNFIHVKSVAPPREEPLFITFVSGKLVPKVGEFLRISTDQRCRCWSLRPSRSRRIKCRVISQSEFPSSGKG